MEDFQAGLSYDTEDAHVKKANVKGQEATLVVYKNDDYTILSWIDNDIYITISGDIPEDDIFILANSFKRVN